jgi:hypothetical protein
MWDDDDKDEEGDDDDDTEVGWRYKGRSATYRVRKLNLTVLHFFSKNAINKLIFNIFCSNLQVMFIGIYFNGLFEKIATKTTASIL